MQFKEKKQMAPNNILSLSRNLTNNVQGVTLNTNLKTKSQSNVEHQQKMKIKVYLTDDSRIFIDRATAYALGLAETRSLMLETNQKTEITDRHLEIFKARENLEIEYEKLIVNKEIPIKPKIEVFVDNIDYYISISAAYSLGLINVEVFNNMPNELYKVSDNLLVFLKNKYEVLYTEIENQNKKSR